VCKGSQNRPDSPLPADKSLPLQGQEHLSEAILAICETAFGVFLTSLVSLEGGGQGSPGENPTQGCWHGVRPERTELRREVTGAEPTFPVGEETPSGYGPNFQDCEGDRQSGSQDMAADGGRATRSADCPLNLRQMATRLEIRRNFFSNRVIDNWNMFPSAVKNARTVASFKLSFKNHRSSLVSTT
jgi:hypothetical protein